MTRRASSPRTGARSAWPVWALVALLAVLAVPWLGYQGWRALETRTGRGAIDLRLRHAEVTDWLAGRPVYPAHDDAMYPPASYVLLAPVLGPLELPAARVLWLALELVLALAIGRLLARGAEARDGSRRWLFLLLPFGTYPLGASMGNGQLGAWVLAALLALVVRLARTDRPPAERRAGRAEPPLLALLAVLALVKPTLAAPFFWLLLARGGVAAAALCVALYAALTWLASLWQPEGPLELLHDWYRRGRIGAQYGASRGEGAIRADGDGGWRVTHVNLHSLLGVLGLARHAAAATLAALLALGAFVGLARRAPLWTLAGVTALVARSMTYHAWYDDVLLLLPLVALWRLHRGHDPASPRRARAAGALFAANLALLLAPGAVYALPRPLADATVLLHTGLLALTSLYLALSALRAPEPRAAAAD